MNKGKIIKFLVIISIVNTVLYALLTNFGEVISFLLTMDVASTIIKDKYFEEDTKERSE